MTTPRLSLSLSHSFALRSFARSIRKDEPKVVDTADTTAQDKPQGTCVVVVVPPTTLAHELTKSLTFPTLTTTNTTTTVQLRTAVAGGREPSRCATART